MSDLLVIIGIAVGIVIWIVIPFGIMWMSHGVVNGGNRAYREELKRTTHESLSTIIDEEDEKENDNG